VPDDLIEVGYILGAHGIRGWIKIQPFSSDSIALGAAKRWWLLAPESPLNARQANQSNQTDRYAQVQGVDLVWAKPHGTAWIACLKNCPDRNAAQALKGHTILVSRADFPALDDDEYYWIDLIGCQVVTDDADEVDESGEPAPLGVVESIQDSPAHPLLMIRQQHTDSNGNWSDRLDDKGKPVYALVPFVQAHVGEVDLIGRSIVVHWPRDF